jgi:NADPH-dependent 2,4-dienoyl-CoA reductase/sulfur reductase-like enzyme/rhodanese-related sulfurtransferase
MAPRIVIIGGVAAGASCATRARRLSEDAEIIVLERGPFVSFANCGLPYYLGGEIADRAKLIVQTAEAFHTRFNVDVRTENEAEAIDPARKVVRVRELHTGRSYEEPYDELVLAVGAEPLAPPIPGLRRPGHFFLRSIPDVDAILEWINSHKCERAVVIGGGYIGLETAEQLHRRGLDVTIVEALPQVMAPLDPEMAAYLHEELGAQSVALLLNDPVAAFEAPSSSETSAASTVVLRSGRRLPADIVILGLGVRPNTKLAEAAGIELGPTRGIRVDEHMRTSVPHIWAAGDAVEVKDFVTGQPALVALAGPANRQGRIIADNIFGIDSRYAGTLGTSILRLFSLSAACTGANEKRLRQLGRPHEVVHLHPSSHASYYPGAHPMAMKVLFEPATGRVLGAQVVGRDGVDKRIDVLSTAIRAGMTVDDLAELELAYAPPFASAKDPVNMAGMIGQNVRRGLVRLAQWHEIRPEAPFVVLDVRGTGERAAGAIPGSIHIPLDELRSRLAELPRDREIVVHCAGGQRSYYAARILAQNGFKVRNLTGAFRTWKTANSAAGA